MSDARKPIRREDFSALDAHHRVGKVFTPPLLRMPAPIQLHSWQNERLPEVLWAVLLSGEMAREEYMPLFCDIAKEAMRFRGQPKVSLSHTALAALSTDEFNSIFGDLLKSERARLALAPLKLLERLPGRSNWVSKLPDIEPSAGWEAMARAVAASFDRQSKSAVDAQWLRVMFLALQHRLVFSKEEQTETIDMLCAFPEGKGVPDWAVTTIGSIDAAIVGLGEQDQTPTWSQNFWDECLQKTDCVWSRWKPPTDEPQFDYEPAKQRWGQIYAELVRHFLRTMRTTDVDARHDAVFGIALYAMSLVTSLMRPFSTRPSGRHLLRSLVETHITLAYLIAKDDPDLWRAYRVYGTGQAKLAFLKLVEQEDEDLPKHVDVEVLERLANEDMWQEFVPIDVGHWADLNARKMAEVAGIKDIYDNYYLWPSGFVHAHWSAVRDSVFDICANPLHRFHRIPRPARLDMEDVCFDATEIMNKNLELVSRAYPSFDLRFDARSSPEETNELIKSDQPAGVGSRGVPPGQNKEPIAKTYQPAAVEGRIYAEWEAAGAFRAGRPERAEAAPYCIVIPPPNVTGSLHMGHALNNTLQDILCRFERMRGKDVLWQPGTDHAGIATQAVVERQLMERQEPGSREMGREAFIRRVWEWKAESGGAIIGQLKRLGASCDWSRERFTMDEGLSRAVAKVFVELYRSGLIYKDKRLVNWDPKLKTAISDLEVQQVETKGSLWYIKYPVEGSDESIVVATTRPETMLGDTAVAVHPENEHLKHLIGKFAILPLVGRRIPIIGDDYADPEKGSGAVKITPAHDFNDFEVGKRHNLPLVNVLDVEGSIQLQGNSAFLDGMRSAGPLRVGSRASHDSNDVLSLDGLDRFEARKRIVALLETRGLIEKIEQTTHTVPHGDRSGAVIEPYLTDQWYVDARKLAQPAIEAVRAGRTVFVPEQWEGTFFNWMENIQPWCISRQIWWGHQIPAWYGRKSVGHERWAQALDDPSRRDLRADPETFVAASEAEAIELARQKYGCDIRVLNKPPSSELDPIFQKIIDDELVAGLPRWEPIWRDEDVLDTWFSSALWPFSTLGWPDETPDLKRFYPTSVLVTGFDIIFFWVARMMMMGLHFMKEVPFPTVYIHALVRDATGAKMSKSKGNVIDPLQLIDEYGADALRFTLAAMAAQGRDIKLSSERVAGYRNFATKLWNAARFAEINGCATIEGFDPRGVEEILNRWIAHETAKTAAEITEAISVYRFNEAAAAAYRFVWNIYCDWYLELAKPLLTGPDGAGKDETRAMVAWARDEILKLLHPFMPFITEELWAVTASTERESLLALSKWPSLEGIGDARAEAEIGWVIDLITAIRSVRAEMNVNVPLPLNMVRVGDHVWERAQRWSEFIKRMAKISEVNRAPTHQQGSVQLVVRGEVVELPLTGVIDLAAERARLAKEMAKCDADIARVDAKLGNPNFVARAPEDVVEEEKEKRDEAQARKTKIAEALERLQGAA